MLALVNGGAAIALLAYLGNFVAHAPDQHPPHLADALSWFGTGLLATVGTVLFAYLTQLQLYNEERRRHEHKPFDRRHSSLLAGGIILAFLAVISFFLGCLTAAPELAKLN
jgi:preprotein translocase subunit SecY